MFTLNNLKKCIYNSKRLVEVHIYLHTAFWEIFAKHFINIEIGEDRELHICKNTERPRPGRIWYMCNSNPARIMLKENSAVLLRNCCIF